MEAKAIFEADSRSVKELFIQNGQCFYIPPYQRNYSWSAESVDKLIDDSLHGFNKLMVTEDSFTFVGTIITIHDIANVTIHPLVKHQLPSKVLVIIDGQQRLTTLIMMCIAMHNRIKNVHSNFSKYKERKQYIPHENVLEFVDSLAKEVMAELVNIFIDRKDYGEDRRYPKMIRAFKDTWSTDKDKLSYNSPLASLIKRYDQTIDQDTEFKPAVRENIESEKELIDRYTEIVKRIKRLKGTEGTASADGEDIPRLSDIIKNIKFQSSLSNYDLSTLAEFLDDIEVSEAHKKNITELSYLSIFCKYILNRVALTVVRGKNEDYAFTIFESLNTTGEPLTAFETFKPKVVNAEGLDKYENSNARKIIDEISEYFATFKSTDIQKITSETLISFALAESGRKLSNRLPEQRAYLRGQYNEDSPSAERDAFISHLRDTAKFIEFCWTSTTEASLPPNERYTLNNQTKLCLAFLRAYGHTVTIAPSVRYFSQARSCGDGESGWKNFECVVKAMTAFSILWRASHSSTSNLDQEYRHMLSGQNTTLFNGLARTKEEHVPTVNLVKKHLYTRLLENGEVASKSKWVEKARHFLQYGGKQSQIVKFVLLAAYNDAIVDPSAPGLIKKGRLGCSPQLTYERWTEENAATLEHIAPQKSSPAWPEEVYSDPLLINSIGNLVLLPKSINSSLGNSGWDHKKTIYAAFAAQDLDEAQRLIENTGIDLSMTMEDLTYSAKHIPQLESIVKAESWDASIIKARSSRILELAWDTLFSWLEPDAE